MNYGENITEAFWIALRNPYLWFFGLFVGGTGFTVSLSGQTENFGPSPNLARFLEDNLVALIIVGVVFVVSLMVVSIALSVISQAGLVAGVAALREGGSSSFSSTWRSGTSHFWRMLGLLVSLVLITILLSFVAILPTVLVALVVLSVSESVGLSVALILLAVLVTIALFLLFLVPLTIISAFATRTLVLDDRGVFDSVGEGYELFRNNIGKSLVVLLIQFGIVIAISVSLGAITFAAGFLASSLLSPLLVDFSLVDVLLTIGTLFVFSIPFLILGAIVGTFTHAYWTHAYLQLRQPRRENDNSQTTGSD